jgi:sugar lactone lactonase YvrE
LLLLLSALPAAAQDMPLSQVLIEGEGWRASAEAVPGLAAPEESVATKDGAVYRAVPAERAIDRQDGGGETRRAVQGTSAFIGLALWPDGGTLVAGEAGGRHLWAFRVEPDGRLTCGDRYYALRVRRGETDARVTALAVDTDGRLYAATALGVQVFDPTGRLSGVIPVPDRAPVTALAFAGPERGELAITSVGKTYVRKVRTKGVAPARGPLP